MSQLSNVLKVIAIAWILLYLWQLSPVVNTQLAGGHVPPWFVDFAQLVFSVGPGGLLFLYSMRPEKIEGQEDAKEKERIEKQRLRDEEFGNQNAEPDLPQRVNIRGQVLGDAKSPVTMKPTMPAPAPVPESSRSATTNGGTFLDHARVRSYFGEKSAPAVENAVSDATTNMDQTQSKEFVAGFSLCLELALKDQLDFETVVVPPKTVTVKGYTIKTKAFLRKDKFVEVPAEEEEHGIVASHPKKGARPPNGNGKGIRPISIPQPPAPPAPIGPETDPSDELTADPQAAPKEAVVQ